MNINADILHAINTSNIAKKEAEESYDSFIDCIIEIILLKEKVKELENLIKERTDGDNI